MGTRCFNLLNHAPGQDIRQIKYRPKWWSMIRGEGVLPPIPGRPPLRTILVLSGCYQGHEKDISTRNFGRYGAPCLSLLVYHDSYVGLAAALDALRRSQVLVLAELPHFKQAHDNHPHAHSNKKAKTGLESLAVLGCIRDRIQELLDHCCQRRTAGIHDGQCKRSDLGVTAAENVGPRVVDGTERTVETGKHVRGNPQAKRNLPNDQADSAKEKDAQVQSYSRHTPASSIDVNVQEQHHDDVEAVDACWDIVDFVQTPLVLSVAFQEQLEDRVGDLANSCVPEPRVEKIMPLAFMLRGLFSYEVERTYIHSTVRT